MGKGEIKTIVIAGGGTGGHIYPGIAIAEALEALNPQIKFFFYSGCRPIESEIYKKEGKVVQALPVSPTKKGIVGKIWAFRDFLKACKQVSKLFKSMKPDLILGTGGYTSAPVFWVAKKMKIPFYIHEQNSIPGKVNRYFSRWARKCFCTFKKSIEFFGEGKSVLTGFPLRKRFFKIPDRATAQNFFNLNPDLFTIFIQGGSQGARFLNLKLVDVLKDFDVNLGKEFPVQILWSAGKLNFDELKDELEKKHFQYLKIQLKPFINDIEVALGCADLVISRAGAGSIAEILMAGKPSILIPLPTSADNHQKYNAEEITVNQAGEVLEENQINTPRFREMLERLLRNPALLQEMSIKSKSLSRPDAGLKIAEIILNETC